MLQWKFSRMHCVEALKLLSNYSWQVVVPLTLVLTTSVLVILASSSVRLSRLSLWSVWSSCRPQTAAPMLPVAIMEGGFIARRSSGEGRGKCINAQLVKEQLEAIVGKGNHICSCYTLNQASGRMRGENIWFSPTWINLSNPSPSHSLDCDRHGCTV